MGVLTQDMRDILASAMLAFVATVRRDGSPSLSPKASTIPYDDDHLLFVDMASPQTIANLRNDPRIEINSVDFIRRRGYRFAGTAQVLESAPPAARVSDQCGHIHAELARWCRSGCGARVVSQPPAKIRPGSPAPAMGRGREEAPPIAV